MLDFFHNFELFIQRVKIYMDPSQGYKVDGQL